MSKQTPSFAANVLIALLGPLALIAFIWFVVHVHDLFSPRIANAIENESLGLVIGLLVGGILLKLIGLSLNRALLVWSAWRTTRTNSCS